MANARTLDWSKVFAKPVGMLNGEPDSRCKVAGGMIDRETDRFVARVWLEMLGSPNVSRKLPEESALSIPDPESSGQRIGLPFYVGGLRSPALIARIAVAGVKNNICGKATRELVLGMDKSRPEK